ncbi:MAG: hypothetical protein ACYCZN_03450 [Candidatus Dormibacteria bacterium]
MNRGSRRSGGYLSRLGGLMTGLGAAGLLAMAILGAAPVSAAVSSLLPTHGTLYFTCLLNQGTLGTNCASISHSALQDVQMAQYTYTPGTGLAVQQVTSVANTKGADGVQFLPNQDLVVAGQSSGTISQVTPSGSLVSGTPVDSGLGTNSNGQVDHISMSPSGDYLTAGGYSGGGMSIIPVKNGTIQNGISCTLTAANSDTPTPTSSFVMDTVIWDGNGQAYYTESLPGGSGGDYGGYGAFGKISITYTPGGSSCSAVLTQLLTNFPAAHGMTYDPSSQSIIMFGSTMIAQIPVANVGSSTATVASEITFNSEACTSGVSEANCRQVSGNGNSQFDQGAVDGLGHIFVSDNNGNLVFVDYAGTALISNASYVYDQPLTMGLDDVAPLLGPGGPLTVNTNATPGTAVPGQLLSDTVTSVQNATGGGHVSFQLFGPDNPTCAADGAAPIFGPTAPALYSGSPVSSGPGASASAGPGTYQWLATYTNDTLNPPASATSGCGNEPVVVAGPTLPTLTITKTADASLVNAGGTIGYTVTLSNSGTVLAYVTSLTDPLPSGAGINWTIASQTREDLCAISGSPQVLDCSGFYLRVGQSEAVHVTSTTTAASCGIYPNTASYTATAGSYEDGSASLAAVEQRLEVSGSAHASETVTCPSPPPPTPNTPAVTTVPGAGGPVGTALSDTAHVTGIVSPGTSDSVSFALYSDPSCTTLADNLGNASLTGPATSNGVPAWTASSPGSGYAPSVAGTYYWGVSFNSVNDPANLSSSMLCGEPVTITASGGTLGAHTTPTPPPAGAVKAASTPTPNTGADLFLPGLLAALALFFGGLLLLTGGKLRRNPSL